MNLRLSAIALMALTLAVDAPAATLSTHAERTDFTQTGRYDETIELCAAFAQEYPDAVRCEEFGRSPEGRPLLSLVVSHAALTPEAAHKQGLPVVVFQGGIHAGEIDGKDAGFLAVREMLQGKVAKGALDKLVLVFVPVFNVDGHERFGAWNRPNQRGPEQMGWRTTAQNHNLNRDYAKATTPEMRAMLGLIGRWDPIVYTDLHVTDGAQFEHDVSITLEPLYSGDADLRAAGLALRTRLLQQLTEQGSLPLPFYPSFVDYDNPASGFDAGVAPPRFSTGYMTLRNRFGVLVETHSWKDYKTRVAVTRNTIVDLIEAAAAHGPAWLKLAQQADARAGEIATSSVPLAYKAQGEGHLIDFRGYAYTRTPSAISGALATRYDESKPQIWKIPLRDDVQPSQSVTAPGAGYVVPAAHAQWMAERLSVHGIEFRKLAAAIDDADTHSFRASKVNFAATSVEGHQPTTVEGEWKPELRDIAAGSLFVPIAQAKARLVVALLEPQAPDSYAAWGEFNAAFERKEYMEGYVAEEIAVAMLKDDPKVAAEFNQRLASDPAFAADPGARLDFFARRHASWDERYNLYPLLRMDKAPE
ncbi:MAG TPA: M14 family metallopeptidase [Xanthomonadales bacterium]|nr:M14 family metallopeptidase [Xanthomonadales bacterium]